MNRIALFLAASLLAAGGVGIAAADHVQTSNGRAISFDHKTGNEWWVEVVLGGADADAVSAVHARDTNGDWRALTFRDWGAWAASFHIEPGHDVWFRATWSDGTTIESCAFTHPDGVEQCEESPPIPPPSDEFDFDHKTGNEWWVEVLISPKPVAAQAMDTGGAWKTLTFRDWGAWAASFHIEPGHDVRFRAQDSSGAWHESCWFTHPAGVEKCDSPPPPPPPPPGEFDATFSDVSGNEWWVQVDVDANEPIASVHARIADETWHALTKRSWGAWAASFHVPDGSLVEFRATSTDGDTDLSDSYYRWPDATPVARGDGGGDVWPQEGSYAVYSFDYGSNIGGVSTDHEMDVTYRFMDGAWQAHCLLQTWTTDHRTDSERTLTNSMDVQVAMAPPTAPTEVQIGDEPRIGGPYGCRSDEVVQPVVGQSTEETKKNGEPVVVDVWHAKATETGSCGCGEAESWWDTQVGLVVRWDEWTVNSEYRGELLDTDAPIAPGDDYTPRAHEGWPFEGSFVEYEAHRWSNGTSPTHTVLTSRFVYTDGAWRYTCTNDGGESTTGVDKPGFGPLDVSPGDHILIDGGGAHHSASACASTFSELVVRGQFPERTTRDGSAHTATVWWTDETQEADDDGIDDDAWYDVDTGLLLRWEHRSADRTFVWMGRLTNTDAPLSSG